MSSFPLLFLPNGLQILSLAGLLVVVLGFIIIGAALGGRKRLPEADLLVGWAVVSSLFIILGGTLDLNLSKIALVTTLLALGAALVLWRRREPPMDASSGKILLCILPLLLATASMQPSQWDEFSQWLPNARYLAMFDVFPGPGHPVSDSVFPSYPPGMTVVFYLVGRLIGQFTDTVAPWFNLLLLASCARLMVRQFRADSVVSWGSAAWGVLGITIFATTFVPKLVLSSYADTATATAFGFAAVLGLRLWNKDCDRSRIIQFALVFALLPITKQGNFALMGLLVLALALDAWRQGGQWQRGWMILAAGLIPSIVVTLAWRFHVAGSGGDMGIRGWAEWQWELLPEILTSMRHVAAAKGGYFGLGLALLGLALIGPLKNNRLIQLFAACFVGYNLFLLFVYIAILGGYESANAASFWRYNTHLGIAEMLVAALLAGQLWRRFGGNPGLTRAALILGGATAVILPFAAQKYIRFDQSPVKAHALATIAEMKTMLPSSVRLMVIDARGTGFFSNYAEYHLGFGRQVVSSINALSGAPLQHMIALTAPDAIWVRTLLPAVAEELGLPLEDRASHLLAVENGKLRLVKSWPFPADMDPAADKD